jgi:arylsulfate sulfotransferase
MRVVLRFLIISLGAVVLAACSSGPGAGATPFPPPGPLSSMAGPCMSAFSLEVSSGDLVPAFDPAVRVYELGSFTTLQPVSVVVHGANASLDGQVVTAEKPFPVSVEQITPSSTLSINLCGSTYVVHLLPADFPTYAVSADHPTPGHVFLAPFSWSSTKLPIFLMILTELGDVLYYRRLGASAFDFKQHKLGNGATRYSYISSNVVTVMDESFRPIAQHLVQATANHPAYGADVHDFVMFDDEHFIITAYADKIVGNLPAELPHPASGARVQAGFVQEVQAGQVIFEWDSTDHPELYALSTEGNNFSTIATSADYAHLNAVIVDPSDQNLILSFRHLDAVLKVRRTDGAIMWRLGGPNDSFGTTPEQKTSHQHFPVILPDGRLQIYDNGNARQATRIVTYQLDEEALTVDSFDAFAVGAYTWAMGSMQDVGASSLFLGLGALYNVGPDLIEVDRATGRHTFELNFDQSYQTYRAYKVP